MNKCFVLVEYHYLLPASGQGSWSNDITLWDVYENSKYGYFDENHYIYWRPKVTSSDELVTCEATGRKCKTMAEFQSLVRPFMND